MTFYLDTSVIVAAVTNEAAGQRVRSWLAEQVRGELIVSDWVSTEVSSALALKVRTGDLTQDERKVALHAFRRLTRLCENRRVLSRHFREATRLIDEGALSLRAADALHLAVAMDCGAILCTLDQRFAAAAQAVGALTSSP